jgi:hydroxymethylpyrimidine/phosphomethylpyrimidine kinase
MKSCVVAVVGGLDPSGGAGILRDFLTSAAMNARAHIIASAFTEQSHERHRVEARDPAALEEALTWAVGHVRPAAVKVGMLPGPAAAAAVLAALDGYRGPVVVDPVLASSRGGRLWAAAPAELMPLLRRATLVTPNAPEAEALTGLPVRTTAAAEEAGRALLGRGVAAVLVKGGHIADVGGPVTDVLLTSAGARRFSHARATGPAPRGTGCALSTALAVELGRGAALPEAIERATAWLAGAIAAARDAGNGERHLD